MPPRRRAPAPLAPAPSVPSGKRFTFTDEGDVEEVVAGSSSGRRRVTTADEEEEQDIQHTAHEDRAFDGGAALVDGEGSDGEAPEEESAGGPTEDQGASAARTAAVRRRRSKPKKKETAAAAAAAAGSGSAASSVPLPASMLAALEAKVQRHAGGEDGADTDSGDDSDAPARTRAHAQSAKRRRVADDYESDGSRNDATAAKPARRAIKQGFAVEVAPRVQAGTHQLFSLEEDVPPRSRSRKEGKKSVGEASGVLPTPTTTLADVDATMAAALAFRTNHLFGARLARVPVGASASMRKRKQQALGGAVATKFTR